MTDTNDDYCDWKELEKLTYDTSDKRVTQKTKSSAQVARCVSRKSVRQNAGGLKPDYSRSYRLVIRFLEKERNFIVSRAENARMTISEYARLTLLKSPGLDPQRNKQIMKAKYELHMLGVNINQIAKHLNGGGIAPAEAMNLLSALTDPMDKACEAISAFIVAKAIRPYE